MDEIGINIDHSEKNINLNNHKQYNNNNLNLQILKESLSDDDNNFGPSSVSPNKSDIGLELLANNKKTIKQDDTNRPDDNSEIDIKSNNNSNDNLNNNELNQRLKQLESDDNDMNCMDNAFNNLNNNNIFNQELNFNNDDNNQYDEKDNREYDRDERENDRDNDIREYDRDEREYEEQPKEPSIEDLLKEKQDLLMQFDRLQKRGIKLSREYTLASNIDEMRFEYNRIKTCKEIDNSVMFSRKMLMAFVTCLEFLNNRFDPFEINLDGWSESVHENVGDYDDVFEELYEKYKSKANVAPEIKLMLMLGGSAFMFHLTSNIFKSSMPQFENVIKKNPNMVPMPGQNSNNGLDLGKMMNMMGNFGNLMGNINPNNEMPSMPSMQPENNMSSTKNINIPVANKSPSLRKSEKELSGPDPQGLDTLLKSLGSDSAASETAGGSKKRKNRGRGLDL